MNNFEKIIYNNFLEVSKKVNNRPVKYRKDFNEKELLKFRGKMKVF